MNRTQTACASIVTLALWLSPASAHEVESAQDVADSKVKAALDVQIKVGQGGQWSRADAAYPKKGDEVSLRVKAIPMARIKWYLVFPDITRAYENANPPWKPDPYKWKGFDKIDYYRVELTRHRDSWEIAPFEGTEDIWQPVRAWYKANKGQTLSRALYHPELGTFRFQALVELEGGRKLRSAGLEDIGDKGISTRVTRISVREGGGYLGYVTSFYNVPGIFGSVSYQSNHYIGVDCADMLVAAHGRWKGRAIQKNYNVSMLVAAGPRPAEADLDAGVPAQTLKWGDDIEPGDLIAVRYEGRDRYQHIGVLHSDTDGDGVLSARDTVLHAGPHPVRASTLDEGAFDGHVAFLRPKKL